MSGESEAAVKGNQANLPLKSLGKYLIERKLGQGGMGTVYLAKHTDLKKMVALKVLSQDKAKNPTLVKRFKAEAQAAGQLEHPNIVAVFDTGEVDGYLYIAMEYVDGIDLFEQVKRRGVIPVKRSIDIIKQVASALQHAFEQNIVHRDIKPSNLLLRQDGVVKVTDLGLARSIDDTLETNITRAGTTVGTVDYMAPEQARSSKSADIRSDIYSLGCTWYQMLTGEPPFPDGSLTNKLQAHAIKPIPDPRELNENIPEGLIAILQRMMSKKPEDRYQSPAELLDDLEHSKLTKAAFSNEIFSDLSDYEMSTTEIEDEEENEEDDDDDPPYDHPPQRKLRSNIADEAIEDQTKSSSRQRRRRAKDEPEAHVDDKPQSRGATPQPLDDTQPVHFRKKSPSHSDDPEEQSEDDSPSGLRKKIRLERNGEDSGDASSPTRKRSPTTDGDHKSTPGKQAKSTSSDDPTKTKSSKQGPKPLPPKRQALPTETNEPAPFNFEALKYAGIVASLVAVIGGLGLLIFRWGSQIDTVNPPLASNDASAPTIVSPPTAVPPSAQNKQEPNEQPSVTVTDPPKQNSPERSPVEYDIARAPLPGWATSEAPDTRDLPTLSVGPGPTTATHFSDLGEALRTADKTGAVVKLTGNGPFLMSRVELGNGKKIVLMAAEPQDQPLIILKPDDAVNFTGIVANNVTLDLRGLHFALDKPDASVESHSTMITVTDGQLFVRNCSFTSTGAAAALTALAFTSIQDTQNVSSLEPQLLLDRVTIRGNSLTGLLVNRTSSDIVIQDSLFVTGIAPAIEIKGDLLPSLSDVVPVRPRRTIRVLRSTLCARTQVLELSAENLSKPPLTAILFQDSVCSAEGSGNSAVLASATRWPSVTSTTSGWLTNLSWTSISSLYLGFDRLLDLDKSYKVNGLDNWQRVWAKKWEPNQFQPILWQETVFPELSSVLPYDFNNSKLPYLEVKTFKGNLPGCAVDRLSVPDAISQPRLLAMGQRPLLPAVVRKPGTTGQIKKIDLGKEDLGLALNRNDWQSGAVFEATGFGTRFMSPAKISGKSVRIVFRQADGGPLKIQPKVPDQKVKPDHLGLFNIENGSIDLQFASLESSQTSKPAAPPWLINARNATVILRGCQLSGPMQQDVEQHLGLIQWTTTAGFQTRDGFEVPFLAVADSMLVSTKVGIRAECAQGNLFLRNSVVAIRGIGINLLPNLTETRVPPALDLEHVTFSTTNAAIRVEAMPETEVVTSPIRLFVDCTAICPPVELKGAETPDPVILECVGPLREKKQIEWWGSSNGIAKEVKTYLRQTDADPITSPAGWIAAWGESNEFRLLTGTKGVNLNSPLPNKWGNLKATSFSLDPQSPGATWANGGRPVGADVRLIENAIMTKKAPAEPKPSTPAPQTMTPVNPNKKNQGF